MLGIKDVTLLCYPPGTAVEVPAGQERQWPRGRLVQTSPGSILGLQSHKTFGMQLADAQLGEIRAEKQGSVSLCQCIPLGEMQPLFLWFSLKVQLWRENWLVREGSLLLDITSAGN